MKKPVTTKSGRASRIAHQRLVKRCRPKFYEIICSVGVIGVCQDVGGGDDSLLHAAQEDRVIAFGEISKADFERFGDNWWTKPISRKRWKPTVKIVLELERIV